ncbi:carbohydrate ABC transporter permease [Leptolinea tardivitalis]|uniref:ABC transporter permease n=1 Tax=Leptolinea tardivitalis TaxID=229920 RepID=A0A0P6XN44_9CHLR|nr:ABC transporter permease [Leptolinea tardivitalis]GAP21566.1 carbohydrate ABC transporter membrane protein 1, CUT1 family [Leptolinea tardivitalis]
MQKMPKKYYVFFTLPTLLAFVIAFFIPFLAGIYLSFTEFRTVTDASWVGFNNYILAFTDDQNFINALIFTIKFAIVSVVLINVFAFFLAYLLTRSIPGTNIFRTIFFMPNLIGGIILGYIWQLLINGILINFGVDITFDASYGFWGLVVLMNWQMVGYMMIIYIAGIQSISNELIEAAKIDGANAWQILKSIIVPMVMPAVTICTFLTVANSFKLFDQNLALTAGAPDRASAMLALDIFTTFYGRIGSEGVGQAKAVMFFMIVAAIVLIQLRLTRSREVES